MSDTRRLPDTATPAGRMCNEAVDLSSLVISHTVTVLSDGDLLLTRGSVGPRRRWRPICGRCFSRTVGSVGSDREPGAIRFGHVRFTRGACLRLPRLSWVGTSMAPPFTARVVTPTMTRRGTAAVRWCRVVKATGADIIATAH